MAAKDPCKKHACEIQKCLQANKYLESKCEAVFQEMRRCCAQYPKGVSLSCSGFQWEGKEREAGTRFQSIPHSEALRKPLLWEGRAALPAVYVATALYLNLFSCMGGLLPQRKPAPLPPDPDGNPKTTTTARRRPKSRAPSTFVVKKMLTAVALL